MHEEDCKKASTGYTLVSLVKLSHSDLNDMERPANILGKQRV